MPTLYLLSYATSDLQDRKPHALRAYNDALSRVPSTAHKLDTIRCMHWHIPPREICAWYSGVSEVVQSYVIQDPRARRAIDTSVRDITNAFRAGKKVVFLKTTCGSGTHRSVATAELIGQHVRRLGYKVYVRHAHRPRMYMDRR